MTNNPNNNPIKPLDDLKTLFEAGKRPTEAHFKQLIDSCYNYFDGNTKTEWLSACAALNVQVGECKNGYVEKKIEATKSFSLQFAIPTPVVNENFTLYLECVEVLSQEPYKEGDILEDENFHYSYSMALKVFNNGEELSFATKGEDNIELQMYKTRTDVISTDIAIANTIVKIEIENEHKQKEYVDVVKLNNTTLAAPNNRRVMFIYNINKEIASTFGIVFQITAVNGMKMNNNDNNTSTNSNKIYGISYKFRVERKNPPTC